MPFEMEWEVAGADALGVSFSTFRFTVAFFLSVVAGSLFRVIKNPTARHIYSAVSGFALIFYPFGLGCLNAFIPTVLSYLTMWRMRQHCGTLTWISAFGFLLWCHISSASGQAWKEGKMDFTGAQMVLTLKLISLAVCYQDGLKDDKDLSPYQRAHKLKDLPTPLETLSYIFSAGNLLAGPFFEASDYLQWVSYSGVWAGKSGSGSPSPLIPGLLRVAKGVLCAALHLTLNNYFPVLHLEASWFTDLNMLQKLGIIYGVAITYRLRYYFAWAISESALIFSGLCFNGYDDETGKARWDRCVNTRIRKVEVQTSAARLPADWNIATGNFLRRYVYDRVTPQNGKPTLSTMIITQLVSGFWHGIFPGYALFFVSSAFFFNSSKILYRYERRWSESAQRNPLWRLMKLLYTELTLQYLGCSFMVLYFNPAINVWRSVHFFGHLLIAAITIVGTVFPAKRPRPPKSDAGQDSKAAQNGAQAIAAINTKSDRSECRVHDAQRDQTFPGSFSTS